MCEVTENFGITYVLYKKHTPVLITETGVWSIGLCAVYFLRQRT